MTLFFILLCTLLDGFAALVGGLLPLHWLRRNLGAMLALASGTLISVAVLDMIPEGLEAGLTPVGVTRAFLAGFFVFLILETLVGNHAHGHGHTHVHAHGGEHEHGEECHSATVQPGGRGIAGPLILIGDALHNSTDGVAIASSFLISTRLGFVTTFAILLHELPQEIGDYSILLAQGYSRARALTWLFIVQLSAVLGAVLAYLAADAARQLIPVLIGVSAGGFVYIAAVDLLPELQNHRRPGRGWETPLFFLVGALLMALLGHWVAGG